MGLFDEVGKIAVMAAAEEVVKFADDKGIFDMLLNKKDLNKIKEKSKYDDFLIIKRKKTDQPNFLGSERINRYNFYIYDINENLIMTISTRWKVGSFLSVLDKTGKLIGGVNRSSTSHSLLKGKPKGLDFHIQNEKYHHMDSYIPRIIGDSRKYSFRDGLEAKSGYGSVTIKKDKKIKAKIYFAKDDKDDNNKDQFIMGYYYDEEYSRTLYSMIFATVMLIDNIDTKRLEKKYRGIQG